MQVSRELDYGVRAMLVLAAHEKDVMPKRKIAEEFCIPVNFLALILPKLVHSGLVESLPGPRGGYRIAKAAGRISIFDVACAVDEEFNLNHCLDPDKGCDMSVKCPVSKVWKELQNGCIELLKGVTFEALVADYRS
jgi:Rrf2 family protein